MKFVRNYNNNAALVVDDHHVEWVVVGKGIGFGKKTGDLVDASKITQRFKSENTANIDNLGEYDKSIIDVTSDIVNDVESFLKVKFNDYQYLILADHINFAYERAKEHIEFTDRAVNWEVKKLFPKEYQASLRAIKIIDKDLKVNFTKDELVFLTYHFVNLENEKESLQDTIQVSKIISDIINIIQISYHKTLDDESFSYSRLVSHLRYFLIKKIKSNKPAGEQLDPSLLKLMIAKYPQENQTVQKISTFLRNTKGWALSSNDQMYLILHVWRVTHREN
ncbi:transcription antiterminator [Companilactobacillus paralimentarius DSM 13238 = JCM 10415]|uniref:Transcription antiterminator n=2 Tax=Companilactobacillus paralimentarius TaxID=83526 RepID=A0A0R1PDK6_9LACO|nr:PRD domain-containing protein [Companilactobacillus paralimentarius]KAE9557249.1 antitermination protein BlgG [Companilactobacillus paralimentarius]KRL30576.1 transcription antiterminator [Companilactobacillus paralimentarius DSM 13238 = JCM 10415]